MASLRYLIPIVQEPISNKVVLLHPIPLKAQEQPCTKKCDIDCKGDYQPNYSGCTARSACGPSSTETEPNKSGTEYKSYIKTSERYENGATCPPLTIERPCTARCDIDCAGSWSGIDATLGLGYQTYTRRAHSNVGNCPGNGHGQVSNGPAGSGVPQNMNATNKFIHPKDGWPSDGWQIVWWDGKDDHNRLKWIFHADGKIQSKHNDSLYLKPRNATLGSDIVFSNSGDSHRWRRRDDGKIEYMGSSNYRPYDNGGLCMHTSSNFNNYSLVTLQSCGNANNINLV
jgi:hypothetical protein